MKPKARFIASVIKTAKTESETPVLPFARGTQRAHFIAKRTKDERVLKSA